MKMIRTILFDINGTLTDILTDESDYAAYRTTANFLSYYGVDISPETLKEEFFRLNRQQRKMSCEEYPEFDSQAIFADIITNHRTRFIPDEPMLAKTASVVYRSATRYKLELYSGVWDVLSNLSKKYQLAAVSDGQSLWAEPELKAVKLDRFFKFVLVSGDFGYRKPDRRLFDNALKRAGCLPEEVIYVGNDMYRYVYGAQKAGLKTVFFKSNQGEHSYCGAEPDYIIYDFRQLEEAVAFLEKR